MVRPAHTEPIPDLDRVGRENVRRRRRPPSVGGWLSRPVVVIVAVGIVAAFVRFVHLETPPERVFDEAYYPKSACILLGYSNQRCAIDSEAERSLREGQWDTGAWVHPPLGKWAIAMGELAAGTDPFGWRLSSAVAGTATVVLLAVMVQVLFGSVLWTFVAGMLLAVESLHVVLSRTGILDIFVAFWIVLGLLCMLLDRRWMDRTATDPIAAGPGGVSLPSAVPSPLWRPWRLAAGLALGAAVATKWSGALGIATAILLAFMWEASRRRRLGLRDPIRQALAIEGFGITLFLVLVPAAVYVASYLPWFHHFGWDLGMWGRTQRAAFEFQTRLRPAAEENPYQSEAWQWLLLGRPVLFYRVDGPDFVRAVYANGNPAIFWGALFAIPFTIVAWFRHRDWRLGFAVVAVLTLYLPWVLSKHPEYLFYAVTLSPFLVLICAIALRELWAIRLGEGEAAVRPFVPVVWTFIVIAVVLFAFFWPTLGAGRLSHEAFDMRVWFSSWR